MDAGFRDSCAGMSSTDITTGEAEHDPLMVVVRWNDVQRARRLVIRDKQAAAVAQLRAGGFSEVELAKLTGHDRLAIRRRWHAAVEEILAVLGGDYGGDHPALSTIATCLKCGNAPRVRLSEVRVKVKGGWRIDQPERHASCCRSCLDPRLIPRIVEQIAAAA